MSLSDLNQIPPRLEVENLPRLELQQSMTAMNASWSLELRFEQIALAGFSGIHARLPPLEQRAVWQRLLGQYKLSFGALVFPSQTSDVAALLLEAQDFGASYVNAQVQGRYLHLEPSLELLQRILEAQVATGLRCFIETHRGTVTQDLLRTLEMLQTLPDLNITLDLSHYLLAGEIGSWAVDAELEAHFALLFERTKAIHGRISSAEQIQVGLDSSMRPYFFGWWKTAMRKWKLTAKKGDILPFVTELLPPDYAIVVNGLETTDRWLAALELKAIAEQLWRECDD